MIVPGIRLEAIAACASARTGSAGRPPRGAPRASRLAPIDPDPRCVLIARPTSEPRFHSVFLRMDAHTRSRFPPRPAEQATSSVDATVCSSAAGARRRGRGVARRPTRFAVSPDRSALEAALRARGAPPAVLEAMSLLQAGASGHRPWHVDELLAEHDAWQQFQDARAGDQAAARAFHDRWTRYIAAYCGSRFDAEDRSELTARFFARAWSLVDANFRWQCPFTVYLRAVLVNLSRDARAEREAKASREEPLDVEDDHVGRMTSCAASPEAAFRACIRARQVHAALARLSPEDRRVITEFVLEGCDGREVARALGLGRQAVYQRLYRAKMRLRALLAEEGVEMVGATGREPRAMRGGGRSRNV